MTGTTTAAGTRRAVDQIDAGGIYASRLVGAGPYVFFASTAVDETGTLAADAQPRAPYHLSASANARLQTDYIFRRYKSGLEELGSSIDEIVQLEQYVQLKAHADGYAQVSRGPGFMSSNRPGSAMVQVGDYLPEGAAINTTGLAIVPDPERGFVKEQFVSKKKAGESHPADSADKQDASRGFSEIVTAGPYAFSTFYPSDYVKGIHPEARAEDWIWWGNEVRNETELLRRTMAARFDAVGSSFDNIVNYTLFLTDLSDLYEFDLVLRDALPGLPPSRTVVPVRGMGSPRREGAYGHEQGAPKSESQFRYLREGFDVRKEVVDTGHPMLGHESEAVRVDDLVWISGLLAGGPDGRATAPDPHKEIDYILQRFEAICGAAGTSLANLLRVRAFVLDAADGYAVYAALRKAVPSNPPCVSISVVPGPLQIPGCSVMLDGVAYVAGA